MNQVTLPGSMNGADAFLTRFQHLRAQLPGDPAPRDAAAAAFTATGLPTRKDSAWHYTTLKPIADTSFSEPLTEVSAAPILGPLPDLPRVVFIDGRYQPELSTPPEGVAVTTFANDPRMNHTGEGMPMVALNAMLAEDGIRLHVAANVDAGTLVLLSVSPEGHRPIDFHPRHDIQLDPGARLTLIEIARGEGTYLHNAVVEVGVASDATLTHIRLQEESLDAFHVSTTLATVAGGGTYDAFVLTLGAKLARAEFHARLAGPNAAVHLNGAQLLTGYQHGDITTVVAHDAPNCASRQTIKNVLSGHSRGVFQGRIEVARAAQKTDGYQMNQALLLSPYAEIDCKPQLEIYADDVKCSHGATVGELDADQLFYLRSRGIPNEEAKVILVRSFLAAAMEGITNEAARALLDSAIEAWWEKQAA